MAAADGLPTCIADATVMTATGGPHIAATAASTGTATAEGAAMAVAAGAPVMVTVGGPFTDVATAAPV